MTPLISVVIPTHKRPLFLDEALRSVEAARLVAIIDSEQLEIVVVDDGHDDSTRMVCEARHREFPTVVRYQRSLKGPRAGPASCRNQGIRDARGVLIYLLDDDDAYLSNRFVKSVRLLTQENFDVVLEPSLRVFINDPTKPSYVTGPYGNPENAFNFLMTGGEKSHITPGASAFRKTVFDRAGGYDETLRYGEDGELLLRLCLVGRTVLVGGDPVVRIAIHNENSSRCDQLHVSQNIKALARLYQKMRAGSWPEETTFIRHALSGKLDFALTECRRVASNYPARIMAGARVLRAFDLRCTSFNNLKSVAVWLTKRAKS